MYPHVMQFEERDALVRHELELLRAHQSARRKTHEKPVTWRRALRFVLERPQ